MRWYHDEAHKYPDLVELVNEAMGHKVENEEWPEEDRETKDVESYPAGDAGAENE